MGCLDRGGCDKGVGGKKEGEEEGLGSGRGKIGGESVEEGYREVDWGGGRGERRGGYF